MYNYSLRFRQRFWLGMVLIFGYTQFVDFSESCGRGLKGWKQPALHRKRQTSRNLPCQDKSQARFTHPSSSASRQRGFAVPSPRGRCSVFNYKKTYLHVWLVYQHLWMGPSAVDRPTVPPQQQTLPCWQIQISHAIKRNCSLLMCHLNAKSHPA